MSADARDPHLDRKRFAQRLKAAIYAAPAVDAALDAAFGTPAPGARGALREHAYLRLFPERRLRASPFPLEEREPASATAHAGGDESGVTPLESSDGLPTLTVLSLVPPEDSAGASRPAQLAAELHRRGWRVRWLHALPIFPWPRRGRPRLPRVDVRHVLDGGFSIAAAPHEEQLVLVEAPHPALVRAAQRASGSACVVYDVIDDWTGALGIDWYSAAAELEIAQRAQVLTGSARLLCDELSARAKREVAYLPNAVDHRLFDPSAHWDRPDDLRLGAPTIVYVGALWGEWVDLDLVEGVARALPGAAIHLIGPAGSRPMPSAPNIHLLGPRPRDLVPAYLASADMTLVPFVKSRLTDATSPLKLFESLAMGTPAVSTPLREVEGVPGVACAMGVAETVDAIRRLASEPASIEAMRAYAARHTWSGRIDQLLELTRSQRPAARL